MLYEWDFVMAARCLGVMDRNIMFKHIRPHVLAQLLVAAAVGDAFVQDVLDEVATTNVPARLSLPVKVSGTDGGRLADQIEYTYCSGRLDGYTIYETAALYVRHKTGPDGRLHFLPGLTEAMRERVEELGLL